MERKGWEGLRNIRNCLKAPSLFIHKFVPVGSNKTFTKTKADVCFSIHWNLYSNNRIKSVPLLPLTGLVSCYDQGERWEVKGGVNIQFLETNIKYCHYLMQRKYWKGSSLRSNCVFYVIIYLAWRPPDFLTIMMIFLMRFLTV